MECTEEFLVCPSHLETAQCGKGYEIRAEWRQRVINIDHYVLMCGWWEASRHVCKCKLCLIMSKYSETAYYILTLSPKNLS